MVVVDVQVRQRSDIDSFNAAQEGIGNEDRLGRCDARRAEVQAIELSQRRPLDGADTGQRPELQGGETREISQSEGTRDGVQGRARKAIQETVILSDQVALDLTYAREVDNALGTRVHQDVAIECLACRSKVCGICWRVDGSCGLRALCCGDEIYVSTILWQHCRSSFSSSPDTTHLPQSQ